jgi:stringent starvation protein B
MSDKTPEDQDARAGGEVVQVNFGTRKDTVDKEANASSEVSAPDSASGQPSRAEAKAKAFADLIDRGMVLLTLDARSFGVRVPKHLRDDPALHLNFSHKFFLGDFSYDEHGVRASLGFSGQPFFCTIPWHAVWMMRSHVDGTVVLSADDMPAEIRAAMAEAKENSLVTDEIEIVRSVTAESIPSSDAPPPPAGPSLRLVKG